ncbi:hypothetical protein SBA1_880012 [Candidatus Sulfotelmatobacter kueseliae]|uniref:Uncharacterized protein n=1 Tax=Candidatus Sulfotelmatobacter kueseliae TaxID=2042962 RepID=A0A2U3LA25_9BACT|nr:hypothetical protein SBA1_880012 [Candidatus Sulfotelmatobacter kueseliae]
MEGITRIVSESLARHGFDRPLDYRRLHWSRWFRCQSHHSLLVVPSKPGVFALAEEIMSVGTAALGCPAERSSAESVWDQVSDPVRSGAARLDSAASTDAAPAQRRMLAVTQFFAHDDMAFVLDRMLSRENPMRARLVSGRYFVRFVIIEDEAQRRSICNALNQWIAGSGEKVSGIGAHFATSLELTDVRVGTAALGRPAERPPPSAVRPSEARRPMQLWPLQTPPVHRRRLRSSTPEPPPTFTVLRHSPPASDRRRAGSASADL